VNRRSAHINMQVACARFGASALHLARLHADFAVFAHDTRVLHAVSARVEVDLKIGVL
jgi:hypothetical protein